jgi:hypothetical protein
MKRFFNSCGRYRQSVCLLAGGALPEAEKDQINNHLAACADCRRYYEEIKTVTAPLTNWAGNFAHLQPGQTVQTRWARAIHAAARPEPVRRVTPAMAFSEWWRDVIWSRRRIWAGLTAVWVVILAGNFSLHDHSQTLAVKSSLPSQEMITSFKDQQRILAELLTDHSVLRDAARQKFFSPKPRTESLMVLTT